MASAAVLYTLLTITGGGIVSHSQGYKSLAMCEEAASLALHGRTIEERKAELAGIEAAKAASKKAFFDAHPPRPPRNDWERMAVAEAKRTSSKVVSVPLTCSMKERSQPTRCDSEYVDVVGDGLVQEEWEESEPICPNGAPSYNPNIGQWIERDQAGCQVLHYATDVKSAKCVLE